MYNNGTLVVGADARLCAPLRTRPEAVNESTDRPHCRPIRVRCVDRTLPDVVVGVTMGASANLGLIHNLKALGPEAGGTGDHPGRPSRRAFVPLRR